MVDAHKAALDVIEANQYAPTGVSLLDGPSKSWLTVASGITTFHESVITSLLSIVW